MSVAALAGDIPTLGEPALHDKEKKVVDLMKYVDRNRDAVAGTWSLRENELKCDSAWQGRLGIPYQPSDEYDLRVEFTRTGGFNNVSQFVSHGGHRFAFTLGGWANSYGGFGAIGGRWANENATTIKSPGILHNGRRYSVVVHVRNTMIAASVDGKLVAKHETNFNDLDYPADSWVGEAILGVGANDSSTTFHKIEIAEITGEGKVLREPEGQAAAAAALPAMERFQDAQIVDGQWKSADGELIQESTRDSWPALLLFGDPEWSRYNVTLKAMPLAGKEAIGVCFNVADPRTYRSFDLGTFTNSRHRLMSVLGGNNEPEEYKDGAIEADQWYDIRLEVRGAECRCLLNGVTWFVGKRDERLAKGRIGLNAWRRPARFKDIKVTSEDDKTDLWNGLPKLPG